MPKPLTTIAAAVAALALTAAAAPSAWAQTYKCTQPDGKTAFQDQPCHMSGGTGGSVHIKVTPPSSDPLPPSAPPARQRSPYASSTGAGSTQQTADAQAAQQARQQAEAYNRSSRCNTARRNLGTLKTARPVFQYDNKGDKQYLEDSKRQSEMAAAQRDVAENCR
ncbi:hypothetical protein PMI14_02769 [Acidovorax sp. CF316]|uniref:DUF4124 domain-containing protein n=1 Tax=Acidovorax sp. CF316 TaxID=1144317 RepID=UPI00026BDB38|nr:DUF4124 domain-containing protein [Acidovorax sp. CF316]EJE52558.1 hypothetical protein PMI14_02769 [Acidovorax sp. CF316]